VSSTTYFQKGFNLKAAVRPVLAQNYHSKVVERPQGAGLCGSGRRHRVRLAREFGFCYGVDRAVEYAYETREQFPDRRIFLSGEIIHNPDVNGRIEAMGIRILPEAGPRRALRRGRGRRRGASFPPSACRSARWQFLRGRAACSWTPPAAAC
jgi:hypothetical protein